MKRYVLALEIKPERVDDFIDLHENCVERGFGDQPKAVLAAGIGENLVFMHGNTAIVYIETEEELDEVLERLRLSEGQRKFAGEENPMVLTADPLASPRLRKIYDARQYVLGTFSDD
jgi:L-rhamnose mutarotase